MKHTFVLLSGLLIIGRIASAQQTAKTTISASGGGPGRTLAQAQVNDIMQDIRETKRRIDVLKDFKETVNKVVKSVDEMNPPEKGPIIAELVKALEALKNLPDDTILDQSNEAVKNFVQNYSQLGFLPLRESLPEQLQSALERSAQDPVLSPFLDRFRDLIASGAVAPKADDLYKTLAASPPRTRQSADAQIQAAITEAKDLPGKFIEAFNSAKASETDYWKKVAQAVTAEIDGQQSMLDQQAKNVAEISKQVDAQSANVQSLIDKLPLLVGILCGLFAGLILIIRFYPLDIQTEWVVSGQVIQLLTVVTLLLIILCLAVTHIIAENTIGTLLGGIGGYVLSQGIGRAAARAATRDATPPADDSARGKEP